jgi:hypothetical protein
MANTGVLCFKKIVVVFLILFAVIALSSCKESFSTKELTADSFVLDDVRSGESVTLHKGDELTVISYTPSSGALVEYQGIRGRIDMENYLTNFKPTGRSVDRTGKETARPIILSRMPFGNAIILLIGLSIFTFIAFIVGRLIGLIPFIGKILLILIVLAILAIWTVFFIDFFRTGAIAELVMGAIFLIIGLASPPGQSVIVLIFIKK